MQKSKISSFTRLIFIFSLLVFSFLRADEYENMLVKQFTNINKIHCMIADEKNNILWVGTTGGLVKRDLESGEVLRVMTTLDGLPSNNIYSLLKVDDTVYIGTSEGLALIKDEKIVKVLTTADGLPHNEIRSLLKVDDKIYVGTSNGLAILKDYKIEKVLTIDDGLPDNFIWSLLRVDDKVFFQTYNSGLVILKDEKVEKTLTITDGLSSNEVNSLLEIEGNLYIGTRGGLTKLTFNSQSSIQDSTLKENIISSQRASIIIAGSGKKNNSLWESTEYMANEIYKMLLKRYFNNDEIYYLNGWYPQDVNGDGIFDRVVDAPLTKDEFFEGKDAIINKDEIIKAFEWAKTKGKLDYPLYFFYVGHGLSGKDGLLLDRSELATLPPKELDEIISDYESETGNKVIIVIDSCHSGEYIEALNKNDRVIITSTDNKIEYISDRGRNSFTNFFVKKLRTGESLEKAYNFATEKITSIEKEQKPQIVNDRLARDLYINGDFQPASGEILIANLSKDKTLRAKALIDGNGSIEKVWASIIPPNVNLEFDEQGTPSINTDIESLSLSEDNIYESDFYDFNCNGEYKITIFAESENGDIDLTDTFSINQTNAKECEESNIKLLLKDGWQLLALPTDKEVTDLSKFGNYKSIWSYQNGTWQKPTTLKPEIGFWINSCRVPCYNYRDILSKEQIEYFKNIIKRGRITDAIISSNC